MVQATTEGLVDSRVGLPFGAVDLKAVPMHAAVSLPGMGRIEDDITVGNFSLSDPAQPGTGLNLDVEAYFENPTNTTVNLGPAAFEFGYRGSRYVKLGQVAMADVAIHPGNVSLNLTGRILPIQPRDVDAAGEFFSSYAQGKNATVECRGLARSGDPE